MNNREIIPFYDGKIAENITKTALEILGYWKSQECPVCGADCIAANPRPAFCPMERTNEAISELKP